MDLAVDPTPDHTPTLSDASSDTSSDASSDTSSDASSDTSSDTAEPMDVFDDVEDGAGPGPRGKTSVASVFEVVDDAACDAYAHGLATKLSEMWGMSVDAARDTLRVAKWGLDAANNAMLCQSDRDGAGDAVVPELCAVCYCDPPVKNAAPCGHDVLCGDCWTQYIDQHCDGTQDPLELRCCAVDGDQNPACTAAVARSTVQRFGSSDAWKRFFHAEIRSVGRHMPDTVRCCGADCDALVRRVVHGVGGTARCSCGTEFCFACAVSGTLEDNPTRISGHEPATCQEVQVFGSAKSTEEIQFWNRAKPCPLCGALIIKCGCDGKQCAKLAYCPKQACDHITCKTCKGHFCWICMHAQRETWSYAHRCDPAAKAAKTKGTAKTPFAEQERHRETAVAHLQNWQGIRARMRDIAGTQSGDPVTTQLWMRALGLQAELQSKLRFAAVQRYVWTEHPKNRPAVELSTFQCSELSNMGSRLASMLENGGCGTCVLADIKRMCDAVETQLWVFGHHG
jgi:hypothetical protein